MCSLPPLPHPSQEGHGEERSARMVPICVKRSRSESIYVKHRRQVWEGWSKYDRTIQFSEQNIQFQSVKNLITNSTNFDHTASLSQIGRLGHNFLYSVLGWKGIVSFFTTFVLSAKPFDDHCHSPNDRELLWYDIKCRGHFLSTNPIFPGPHIIAGARFLRPLDGQEKYS